MIELVLAADDCTAVRSALVGGDVEKSAILFASQTVRSDGLVRLLVRDFEFPATTEYSRQGLLEAELKPEVVARVTKRARINGEALVFVHSHPGSEAPLFSSIDDRGERHLAAFLAGRHPELTHAALVVSEGGMRARRLGTDEEMRVISVGPTRDVLFDPIIQSDRELAAFDRQVRIFGAAGQRALQDMRVAIVGLGGTGSLIAQELAHLGVREFILVDPDIIETSNLNRVANASAQDVGRLKVDVAGAYIETVAKGATVSRVQGDVNQAQIARKLRDADLIFGCTDSHGSRAVLQQVAYQYLIPLIDMGVTIAVRGDRISHIFGRVQLLAPGLSCFTCDGLLNPEEVRRDMMTEFERKADPYIRGAHEPAPAVMSLNGTVASLAVTMMLAAVTGLPSAARHVMYNAMASTLRHARGEPKGNCYICSRSGSFARGDSWPLFARET